MAEVEMKKRNQKPVKFGDLDNVIGKKKVTRGSKDLRSIRPSTIKELNAARGYQPLIYKYKTKDGEIKEYNIGCGNSLEDLCLITCALITLWCSLLGMFALLLKAALDTDENSTALWMFFFMGLIFVAMVGGTVFTGQIERARKDKEKAREERLRAKEADEEEVA